VQLWSERLSRFPRSRWPSRLFHTAQAEVAVEIIKCGKIVCRSDVTDLLCDVANQGALWNNPYAHKYVRLYFRPRNLFHLKTEGIKSRTDNHRQDPHMSIPVTFCFRFAEVITLGHAFFVDGNFAKTAAALGSGDDAFRLLNFEKIYHDSSVPPNQMTEIQNARMSEVAVLQELPLSFLECIVCRSIHDERTLRYLSTKAGVEIPNVEIDHVSAIFMNKAIYITEISLRDGVLYFSFSSPRFGAQADYQIGIERVDGGLQREFRLAPGSYYVPGMRTTNVDSVWRIKIEGCLAYEGAVPAAAGLVTNGH
jgi:hypothetical protein